MATKTFIDWNAFHELIKSVPNTKGEAYQDVDTIYRDMSRLVVGWLANEDPGKLRSLYRDVGWEGEPNVRAMCESAKAWLEKNHPGFPRKAKDKRGSN